MAGTERIKVNLVQGENRVQTVVKGQIAVPSAKPDVDKILSKTASAKVRDVSIVPNKVIVDGTLSVQVMYVAFVPDQSVHSLHGDVKFTAYADVEGTQPGNDYLVEFTVEDVSVAPAKNDPQKLDVAAVISTFVKITEIDELEILTEVPAGNEALEKQDITVEHMIGEKATKQVIVGEKFDVPEEKPDVEKILDTRAEVEIVDKKVLHGKVIVEGEVHLEVIYAALKPDQSVHELHHVIKFSDFVEVPLAVPGMNVVAKAEVESAEVEPLLDPALSADVIVKLVVYVSETKTLKNIPTKLRNESGYTKKKLKVDRQVGYGETQVVLRETGEIPSPKPDIMKVYEARVDKVEVTETNILKEKVLVRGYADVEVIYVSAKPSQDVHALHQRLNFRTFVVVSGAVDGMNAEVKVEPEYVSVDQEGADLHTEAVLKVKARVTEMTQLSVYVPAVTPPEVCQPVDYVVKPGDTLSAIAAAYKVSLSDLLAANPQITNPDVIDVGQVIKIPCPPKG